MSREANPVQRGTSKSLLEWNGDFTTPTSFIKQIPAHRLGQSNAQIQTLEFCQQLSYPLNRRIRITSVLMSLARIPMSSRSQAVSSESIVELLINSIGFYPYLDSQLICFFRNSIHLITSTSPGNAAVFEINVNMVA